MRLAPVDRQLLAASVLLAGALRLGLWLLPFGVLRALLAWLVPTQPARPEEQLAPDRVAWAVMVASRYVPRATCLAQALATQALLRRAGCPARLQLGAARSERGQFEAHAWVESRGRVVIGGPAAGRFVPFRPFELRRP